MSELKPRPCPICGAELKIYGPEDWRPTFNDPDSGGEPYNAVCDCGFQYSNRSYDYTEFIACLNRRAQSNEPLTLEQSTNADRIRGMSDEELARWLVGATVCERVCDEDEYCHGNECVKRVTRWLKQPAKEEHNGK